MVRHRPLSASDILPAMAAVLYTLFVGMPLCLVAVAFGLLACMTIVGLPIGITLIAMGIKALSYSQPTRHDVRLRINERR